MKIDVKYYSNLSNFRLQNRWITNGFLPLKKEKYEIKAVIKGLLWLSHKTLSIRVFLLLSKCVCPVAVYRNGEFYELITDNDDSIEFNILNPTGELAEWKITMPTFAQVEFLGLEIDDNSSLITLDADDKLIYVAIGRAYWERGLTL